MAEQERKRHARTAAPSPGKGNAVTNDASESSRPFDLRTIKNLVALMTRHDLSEIDLREGNLRIRLRRGPQGAPIVTTMQPAVPQTTPSTPANQETPATGPEALKTGKALIPIKSPTPGTFYSAPNPGAEPFVQVGARVTPNTVICMIEAMKIFNEIQAECTGVIAEILVENQQPVEYGQVLFQVDPTG